MDEIQEMEVILSKLSKLGLSIDKKFAELDNKIDKSMGEILCAIDDIRSKVEIIYTKIEKPTKE